MAYLLPHLTNGWEVDQAILNEEDRVVVIRFGRDNDPNCMIQDEVRQFWFPKTNLHLSLLRISYVNPSFFNVICLFILPRF